MNENSSLECSPLCRPAASRASLQPSAALLATVRQRAETCAAVLFIGEARELRNGEARFPCPCSAATADVVCDGTNMCVAAFLPPLECSSRREQPVAHCRLRVHLPVRLALVRAVSRTSHSVSHGVGHGVSRSVSHSVSHGVQPRRQHGSGRRCEGRRRSLCPPPLQWLPCDTRHHMRRSPSPLTFPVRPCPVPVPALTLPRPPASAAHAAPLTHVRRRSKGH